MPTAVMLHASEEITPEIADARQFEERLQRGVRDGSFLVLLVNPKYYQQACQELCARFPLKLIDFEELFIDTLRQVVDKANVDWELVLKTDATPLNKDWKNLMRLGVNYALARVWSRTRMGGWAVAQSPILNTTITLERLRKRGYEAMLDYYFKVAPALNEPLYTRSVRTVV